MKLYPIVAVLLALALLTDQLFQYLPHFADFYGPGGVAPDGLFDRWMLRNWRWTPLFFGTDDLAVLYPVFGLWVACTAGLLVGWHTRVLNVAVWFLTMCFLNRNPNLLNGGDDTLSVALLFAGFGSLASEFTDAVLVIVSLPLMVTVTWICAASWEALASSPSSQLTVPVWPTTGAVKLPLLALAPTNVVPLESVSSTTTLAALSGPKF